MSVEMLLSSLFAFSFVFILSECAKILGIFPIPSISHQMVYQPIWRELSIRGHQVTVITPNPLNDPTLTNLTEIDTSSTYEIFIKGNLSKNMAKDNNGIKMMLWLFDILDEVTLAHLEAAEPLLKNPETEFDLIMTETHSPLTYILACIYKAPIIGISSLALLHETHDAVGNPTHPIINPDLFINLMKEMTLHDKLVSVLQNLYYRILYYWYHLPKCVKMVKKFRTECPYLGDLVSNVSLVLINTNPILHFVRPKVPNVVEMGQTHIRAKAKKLPKELQNYLDMSTQGVIYVSFGTNVRGIDLSARTRSIVSEALSELPYNILWKWENDSMPNKPQNVMTRKWFPQQDLLRHKNIKAFVTQGGLQSMEEAITNGVPMVAVPFIGDQPLNAMKMVSLGIGRSIDYMKMTKQTLKDVILDVAQNVRYRQNMKGLEYVFSDHPLGALEKIIWWIEHILRHKGAKHLRSLAADLPWIEYYLIDVAILLLIVLMVLSFLLIWSIRIIINVMRN